MSLLIGIKVEQGYVIAVDSRVSVYDEGVLYCTGNTFKKYIIRNNKLIVTFGTCSVVKLFHNYCDKYPEEDTEKIFNTVINNISDEYIKINKQTPGDLCLLSVFEFDPQKKKALSLQCTKDAERTTKYNDMCGFFSTGNNSKEARKYYQNNFYGRDTDVLESLFKTFDFVNCSSAGGIWSIFYVTPENVKQIATYNSGDNGIMYAPEQLIRSAEYGDKIFNILNKGAYFTTDGWETCKAAIGKFKYLDPKNNFKETTGYGVIADTIVGNIILGEEVGVYNNGGSITLDENGLEITNKSVRTTNYNTITINPNNSELFVIKKNNTKMLWFDETGGGHFKNAEITDGTFIVSNDENEITINPDEGLVFTSNGDEKLKLDITTGNVIGNDCIFNNGTFSGTITSSIINGGEINGTFINTDKDVSVGKTLKIVNGDTGNFFFAISAGGISNDRVCLQAANERTIEIEGGAIYLNGSVFVNDTKVATQSDIKTLTEQIEYLKDVISSLGTA